MQKDRSFWPEWAHFLQQWGISEFAAAFLEAAGPLNVFLAQFLYAGRPLLGLSDQGGRLAALANLFEDREESRSFAAYIREETAG
jgi:hypothetical protein